MNHSHRATPNALLRSRPLQPHCRGGASSLLRLADRALPRLPKGAELADWVQRAAQVLSGHEAVPAFEASELR